MYFKFEVGYFSLLTLPKNHFSVLSLILVVSHKKKKKKINFGYFNLVTLSKNHFGHLRTHLVQ